MDAPAQVKTAIALLWVSLVISMIDTAVTVMPEQKEVRVALGITFALTFAFWATLIHFTAKRRNWARILLLLFTVLGLSIYFLWPQDFLAEPWWSLVATAAYTALDIAALLMLFSGVGAAWFKRQPVEASGAF